jgi:FkbM family methyltransferase
MLSSMPEAPLRLPAGGPTITIDVGVDIADGMRRWGGWYERHLTTLLPRLLPSNGVALDVGANAGAITLSMAHLAPAGQVVAFEAAPPNADRLEANIARSGMRNVRVERVALYDRPCELSLSYMHEHSGGASVADRGSTTAVRIPAITLDGWVRTNAIGRVDLVKIDVEGSEVRVLRGARETLRRFRPTLIVECNPVTLSQQDGATTDDLLDAFDDLGYQLGWIVGRGAVIPLRDRATLGRILGATGIVDLLATGSDSPSGMRGAQAMLGRLKARQRVRAANRIRRPPRGRYVVAPTLQIDTDTTRREVDPNDRLAVTVTLTNTGDGWLSSDFAPHPILLTHRWISPDGTELGDEPRTRLRRPLRPGDRGTLTLHIDAPGDPGHWTVVVRAVQEGFVWLDEFEPEQSRRIPVVVLRPGAVLASR